MRSVKISTYDYEFVYFFPEFYQFLLYLFWGSAIRCIYIYDCYVFWLNWCFYNLDNKVCLSPIILFVIKCTLSDIHPSHAYWLHDVYFSSIYFQSTLPLYLKYVSCRQQIHEPYLVIHSSSLCLLIRETLLIYVKSINLCHSPNLKIFLPLVFQIVFLPQFSLLLSFLESDYMYVRPFDIALHVLEFCTFFLFFLLAIY